MSPMAVVADPRLISLVRGAELDTRYVGVAFGLLLYLAAAFIAPYLGFWYAQAFAFGSPLLASFVAFRMKEYWPVVHPSLLFFFFFPTLLIVLWLTTGWVQTGLPLSVLDWRPWLGWSSVTALLIMAAMTLAWRKYINREWAVVGTAIVVLVYSVWTLNVLNKTLPQSEAYERASVVSANPGLVRVRAWSVTIRPAGPYEDDSKHIVAPETFRAADRNLPVCLFTYAGGLGWRWTVLARCPD